jgi:hypothetical protein
MVMVGKRDVSVSNARKILTTFNRSLREEGFGKNFKGKKGVYKMKAEQLGTELKMFKVKKNGRIGHKIKKDFDMEIPAGKAEKIVSTKSKPSKPTKTAPKPQSVKDKEDEKKGMTGKKKKSKSKTAKGEEDFTGKKGDISKSKGKDVKAENKKVDYSKVSNKILKGKTGKASTKQKSKRATAYNKWVKSKGGVRNIKKGEWKTTKEYKATQGVGS